MLQQIFASLLHHQLCLSSQIPTSYINPFHRIRILDSTHFWVPDKFIFTYQGSRGSGQNVGVKIQVGPAKNNDKTFGTECLVTLRSGDLCIRDLGYFSLEDLDQID